MTPAERQTHVATLLTVDGHGKVAKRAALEALLREQDRDTRHACAAAVMGSAVQPIGVVQSDVLNRAHQACLNVNATAPGAAPAIPVEQLRMAGNKGIYVGGIVPNPSSVTLPDSDLLLSARIERAWNSVMHKVLGYSDYCDSTTSFGAIGYAYTKDAPLICIQHGEELWATLMRRFGGTDGRFGEVQLSQWSMNTVTRRRELWDR